MHTTMRRVRSLVVAATFALIPGSVVAGGEEASTAEIIDSIAGGTANPGVETMYFEYAVAGREVGYSVHSLKTGSDGYDYSVRMMVKLPQAARIDGTTTAQLKRSFEPTEVEMIRKVTAPDGTKQSTRERAIFTEGVLNIERQVDDGPVYATTVDVPERPYVWGIEFLVQRIDLKRYPKFKLRELDHQSGEVKVQAFRIKQSEGGDTLLQSTTPNGSIAYQFTLDASGKIVSVKESPLMMTATRCSRERVEALHKKLSGN